MREWLSESSEATREVGRKLAREVAPDGVILLLGDLGVGKTVLVQGLAEGLGFDPAEIQSPTYTLVREHAEASRKVRLVHVDLYRLEPGEVDAAGIEELLYEPGVKVVEWADRMEFPVPAALVVEITRDGDRRRIRERSAVPQPAAGRGN